MYFDDLPTAACAVGQRLTCPSDLQPADGPLELPAMHDAEDEIPACPALARGPADFVRRELTQDHPVVADAKT